MDIELLKMLAADPLFEGVSAEQIEDMSTFSQEVGKLHLRLKRYKKGAAVCSAAVCSVIRSPRRAARCRVAAAARRR